MLRWLRQGQFLERKPRHGRPPRVNQFAPYLRQRWNEGCQNATRLHRELRAQGYDGSYGMVARLVADWRQTEPVRPPMPPRIDPQQATRLLTCSAEQVTKEQQQE